MNKILFISNSLADIANIKGFAKKHHYSLEHYSKEEWRSKKRTQISKGTKNRHLSVVPDLDTHPLSSPTIDDMKEKAIRNALIMSRGNVLKASENLGVSRATLYRKVRSIGIELEHIRSLSEKKEYRLKKAS